MTELERHGLRGNVRSCRMDRIHLEFRPDGQLASRTSTNPDGTESTSTWDYDEAGRLLHTRSESYVQSYEYDPSGRVVKVVGHSPEHGESICEIYRSHPDGRKKSKTNFISLPPEYPDAPYFGTVEGSDVGYPVRGAVQYTTDYDDAGRPFQVVFQDAAGVERFRVKLRHDPAGHLLEEVHITSDAGLPAELAAAGPDHLDTLRALFDIARTYRYDQLGRRIEERTRMGVVGGDVTFTEYNDHGDPILKILESDSRELSLANDGELTQRPGSERTSRSESRLRYDYDERGNWASKIVEAPSDPYHTEHRTLTYW